MQLIVKLLILTLLYVSSLGKVFAEETVNPVLSTDISKTNKLIEYRNDLFKKSFSNAISKFENLNIEVAYNDFESLIEQSESSDYHLIILADKTAELGFFDLSEFAFSKIKDTDFSAINHRDTKKMFFPKQKIKKSDLVVLAEIFSNIKYNDNANEAIKELENHPRLLAEYDYANYILALGYLSSKKLDEAKPYINSALKTNPENVSYSMIKALAYAKDKNGRISRKIFNKIKKENILTESYNNDINNLSQMVNYIVTKNEKEKDLYLGRYYLGKNDYSKAIRILQGAIGTKKNTNALVYGSLSRCYYELGDYIKALEYAQKCKKLDSKNSDALLTFGDIAFKNGEYKSAIKYYKQAMYKNNKRIVLEKMALAYTSSSQPKNAFLIYDEILKEFQNSYIAYYKKGIMQNNNDIVNIKKALSININYTDAWIDLARIMVDRGNLAVAKNCLSAVNCIEGNANFRYYYYQNILDKKEDEILRTRREFQE